MEYNDVKLGLIGRLRVWNARRIANMQRNQYNKDEKELLEVDYSKADELEEELLSKKRIKKATRDASKIYNREYGKNNDGVGKDDFIEEFLIKKGLKQKKLPEVIDEKNEHSFMDQYSTEKSEDELSYERAHNLPIVYYKIGEKTYKSPLGFALWCVESKDKEDSPKMPMETTDGKTFLIETDKMSPEDKFLAHRKIINNMLDTMGAILAMSDEEVGPDSPFPTICRKAHMVDFTARQLRENGQIEEAVLRLETMVDKVFEFDAEENHKEKQSQDNQER